MERREPALHRLLGLLVTLLLHPDLAQMEMSLDEERVQLDHLRRIRKCLSPEPFRLVDGAPVGVVHGLAAVEGDRERIHLQGAVVLRGFERGIACRLELRLNCR